MTEKDLKTQKWQVMGESFELENRFKIVDYLGSGAYGVVCAVNDSLDNKVVAIKKCKKIFQSRTLAKRTLREVRLLRLFNHENIVKLKTILIPDNSITFTELYVVFELMETDLAQIIRSPQKLKEQHTQYFTYQLLQALKYLHSENVVHRDIKPRNILVNADCCLKLADFGLARVYNSTNDDRITVLTDYVTTRWYRAPEVIVGWPRYTSAVDMWAVGCIIAELIGRTPLFPGADTMKQMELISKIMGKPDEQFIKRCRKTAYRSYLYSLQATKSHELLSILPHSSPLAMDLILNLLEYNPSMRYTAEEALGHGYISEISGSIVADASPLLIPSEEFAYETQELTVDILRQELLREVQYHNPQYDFLGAIAGGYFPPPPPPLSLDDDLVELQAIDLETQLRVSEEAAFDTTRRHQGRHEHQTKNFSALDHQQVGRHVVDRTGDGARYFNAVEAAGAEDVAAGRSSGSSGAPHSSLAYSSTGASAALSSSAADMARRQQEQRRRDTARNLTGGIREPTTRHTTSHSVGYRPPPPSSGPTIELHQMDGGSRATKQLSPTVRKPPASHVFRAGSGTSSTTSFDSRTVTSDPRLRYGGPPSQGLGGARGQAVSPTYPPPFNTRDSSVAVRRPPPQDAGFFSCVRSSESEEREAAFRLDEDSQAGEDEKFSEEEEAQGDYSRGDRGRKDVRTKLQQHQAFKDSANSRQSEGWRSLQKRADQHLPTNGGSAASNATSCVVS